MNCGEKKVLVAGPEINPPIAARLKAADPTAKHKPCRGIMTAWTHLTKCQFRGAVLRGAYEAQPAPNCSDDGYGCGYGFFLNACPQGPSLAGLALAADPKSGLRSCCVSGHLHTKQK